MVTVKTPDGRRLEVFAEGAEQAPALLFHHGTPGAAEHYAPLVAAATGAGFRWVSYTRPGNGGSDRSVGRTVADAAADSVVAPRHGAFLAEHLPDVRPHLMPGEGHLSLGVGSFAEILAETKAFLELV